MKTASNCSIGMAGVQSNQYPRGRDIALQFVAQGMRTMMGGFHVSGYPESRDFLHTLRHHDHRRRGRKSVGPHHRGFSAGALKPNYSVTEGIRAKTGQEDIIVPIITEAQLAGAR